MPKQMTQVKFTIDSDVVAIFKDRCTAKGVSMASVIREWMINGRPTKGEKVKTSTRPQRRYAVDYCLSILNEVSDNEAEYRDNIPEQFEQRIEAAEHSCEQLSEAIACLEDVY